MINPISDSLTKHRSEAEQILSSTRSRLLRKRSPAVTGSAALALIVAGSILPQYPLAQYAAFQFSSVGSPDARPPARDRGSSFQLSDTVVPTASLPAISSATPFHFTGTNSDREHAEDCLAAAAWYEAGNDVVGQRAVIQTVINRVTHPGFPSSICGVVFEGSQLRTGCQFTFACDGSLLRRRPSASEWAAALSLAAKALDGSVDRSVGTATHYHADYVVPWWSGKLERLAKVGPHIFYKWRGTMGNLAFEKHRGKEESYTELVRRSAQAASTNALPATKASDQNLLSRVTTDAIISAKVPRNLAGGAIFLQVQNDNTSGRWAIQAMKACNGRIDCQVFGYSDANLIQKNQALSAQDRDRPLFLFVRDSATALNLALWDCEKVKRPQSSQCLPSDKPALLQLMRDRPAN